MQTRKAQRKNTKIRIGMFGYGGSGKSYSALLLARGLVGKKGKILVLDTEGYAIDMHAGLTDFDVCDIEAPFTVDKFIDCIYEAAKDGYDIVIIDSLSAGWSGKGGLLDLADSSSSHGLQKWAPIKAKHKDLMEAIVRPPVDIICTLRAKQNNKQVKINGKTQIIKDGDRADTENSTEYAFDLFWHIHQDSHQAKALKDRTQLFGQQPKALTIEDGERLAAWRREGATIEDKGVYGDGRIFDLLTGLNYDEAQHKTVIKKLIGKADAASPVTVTKLTEHLEKLYKERDLEVPPQ